jgi:hypothetical protein
MHPLSIETHRLRFGRCRRQCPTSGYRKVASQPGGRAGRTICLNPVGNTRFHTTLGCRTARRFQDFSHHYRLPWTHSRRISIPISHSTSWFQFSVIRGRHSFNGAEQFASQEPLRFKMLLAQVGANHECSGRLRVAIRSTKTACGAGQNDGSGISISVLGKGLPVVGFVPGGTYVNRVVVSFGFDCQKL